MLLFGTTAIILSSCHWHAFEIQSAASMALWLNESHLMRQKYSSTGAGLTTPGLDIRLLDTQLKNT